MKKAGVKAHSVILTAAFGRKEYAGPDSIEKLAQNQATMVFFTMFLDLKKVVKKLNTHYPKAGGEYIFLRESYGKGMAFLSGWIALIVGFSAPIAFATYFLRALPVSHSFKTAVSFGGIDIITISPVTILAASIIIILSLVHYHSLLLGSRIQNGLTIFKITLICIFILTGFCFGSGSAANLSGELNPGLIFSDSFAISLIYTSFAYSGWNAVAYLGGEIKNPGRNIPLSLFIGTFLVLGLYLLLNMIYIYALPVKEMSGVLEVGKTAAVSLFGDNISRYFAAAIAIGILSAVSAMIMTGPRVYYAMSKDGLFFKLFGKLDQIHKTPAYSIFLQAAFAIIMILTSAFDKLLLYIGFTLALFAMLTVAGMIALRIKQPSLVRSYKTFGYPFTPFFFILGNLWIIFFSIKERPVVSLFGLGTIGLGGLIYLYFKNSGGSISIPGCGNRMKIITVCREVIGKTDRK